jgi:hypothetical protein
MEGLNFVPFAIAPKLCKGGSFTLSYLLSHPTFGGIGDASGSATLGVQKPGSRQFARCPGKGTSDHRWGDSNLPVEIVRSQPQLRGLQWSENREESARQRLRPSAVFRSRACPVSLTLGLRLERLLEVFGVNACLCPLNPSQYSSGSSKQVLERSGSVITQILVPLLSV